MDEQEPRVPPDPSGIEEPHDVLAAEEFAMPAPEERNRPGVARRAAHPRALAALVLIAVVVLAVLCFEFWFFFLASSPLPNQ